MSKFNVVLDVIVEAETADKAFADVRSHYCVVNDPSNIIRHGSLTQVIDMFVRTDVKQVGDNAQVSDWS